MPKVHILGQLFWTPTMLREVKRLSVACVLHWWKNPKAHFKCTVAHGFNLSPTENPFQEGSMSLSTFWCIAVFWCFVILSFTKISKEAWQGLSKTNTQTNEQIKRDSHWNKVLYQCLIFSSFLKYHKKKILSKPISFLFDKVEKCLAVSVRTIMLVITSPNSLHPLLKSSLECSSLSGSGERGDKKIGHKAVNKTKSHTRWF